MAKRNKNRKRKKNKKQGTVGLLALELVGVAAFAATLTFAQGSERRRLTLRNFQIHLDQQMLPKLVATGTLTILDSLK